MKRRLLALATAVMMIVGLAAVPAFASWSWCVGFGIVCMAEDTYGNGSHFSDYGPVGACQSMPSGWNDRISSVNNHFQSSGGYITFWWDSSCNGNRQSYGPLATVNDVGWFNNDEWTSYCIGPIDRVDNPPSNSCYRLFP